ncbi:MAG: LacI family DNA-binding transcriptional regulator, partial [Fimbriimonadales bacterium]
TASNILNNKLELHSPETVKRVLGVAQKMGYRPNRLARSLVAKRTHTIGVVMEPNHTVFTRNAYATAVLDGALECLTARHYHLKIVTMTEVNPQTLWAQIDDGSMDGALLIAPMDSSPLLDWYDHTAMPCVSIGSLTPAERGIYSVDTDSEWGIRLALKHLIELGHRQIGFLRGPSYQFSARQREQTFRATLQAHDMPIVEAWIQGNGFEVDSGYCAMQAILNQPNLPTAIVASADLPAFGAMRACQERGLSIPDDISIIGFDDFPSASVVNPPLTTLHNDIHAIGYHAAEVLIKQIETGVPRSGVRLFKGTLVIRESTAPPRHSSL